MFKICSIYVPMYDNSNSIKIYIFPHNSIQFYFSVQSFIVLLLFFFEMVTLKAHVGLSYGDGAFDMLIKIRITNIK